MTAKGRGSGGEETCPVSTGGSGSGGEEDRAEERLVRQVLVPARRDARAAVLGKTRRVRLVRGEGRDVSS